MNNIFIIGNGFDLSHKMETGYKHFIDWIYREYFKEFCKEYFKNPTVFPIIFSPFIEFKYKNLDNMGFINPIKKEIQENEIFNCFQNIEGYISYRKIFQSIQDKKIEMNEINLINYFDEGYGKNKVFGKIIEEFDKNQNWVDIERLYFRLLISEHDTDKLNADFEILKNKFEEYLSSLKIENMIPKYANFFNYFNERRKGDNLVLNFNFTNNFKQYIPSDFEVINIHGELNNPKNKIIFGYGDYESEDYIKLESLDDNKKLKNIKLFSYAQSYNYEKLIQKLVGYYDVHILGHSCGLSDRGILREIMNRQECEKIYIYYHEYEKEGILFDNFKDNVQNLSRCFDNKQEFIRKLISKNEKYKMLQIEDTNSLIK